MAAGSANERPASIFNGSGSRYFVGGLLAFSLSVSLQLFSLVVGHRLDPLHMVRLRDPSASTGADGFDGQFFYRLARDPLVGAATAEALDSPVLRARRIGFPVAARALTPLVGSTAASLLVVHAAFLLLIAVITQLGSRAGRLSPFLCIAVPLNLPFLLSLELVTAELPAAALLFLAAYAAGRRAIWAGAAALAAACLFKEVALCAVAAYALSSAFRRNWREAWIFAGAVLPLAAWQLYLTLRFGGQIGVAALLGNLSAPGHGLFMAILSQVTALASGAGIAKPAGILAAVLWYGAGAVLTLALFKTPVTNGRATALAGAVLLLLLSHGGTAQAFDEVFNFGRQLFILPVGLIATLFNEGDSLSGRRRDALIWWLMVGAFLGAGWFTQEVLSLRKLQ